jgi:quinol monooxygenase YgiN
MDLLVSLSNPKFAKNYPLGGANFGFGTLARDGVVAIVIGISQKSLTQLVKKVNENEKGCLLYQLYHGEEPNTDVFLERYADQAAVEAHRGTEYFKTLGRAMGAFMDGKPVVQRFKQVGA